MTLGRRHPPERTAVAAAGMADRAARRQAVRTLIETGRGAPLRVHPPPQPPVGALRHPLRPPRAATSETQRQGTCAHGVPVGVGWGGVGRQLQRLTCHSPGAGPVPLKQMGGAEQDSLADAMTASPPPALPACLPRTVSVVVRAGR